MRNQKLFDMIEERDPEKVAWCAEFIEALLEEALLENEEVPWCSPGPMLGGNIGNILVCSSRSRKEKKDG